MCLRCSVWIETAGDRQAKDKGVAVWGEEEARSTLRMKPPPAGCDSWDLSKHFSDRGANIRNAN